MKLSTRARYGVRLLVDLAATEGRVPLGKITHRQQVSRSYLQHLISPLVSGGIVGSTRGSGGGIWLVEKPEQVKLSKVIKLLEGKRLLVDCVDSPGICGRATNCPTRIMWEKIEQAIFNMLDSITLKDLLTLGRDDTSVLCDGNDAEKKDSAMVNNRKYQDGFQ